MTWIQQDRTGELVHGGILVLLLALTAGNLFLTASLLAKLNSQEPRGVAEHHPPCEAIPMSLVAADPECADELLHAMNITNVHVLPYGSPVPGMDPDTIARLNRLLDLARNHTFNPNTSGSDSPKSLWP